MEQEYSFLKILLNEDIYLIDKKEESLSEESEPGLTYYGENKKKIAVLVDEANPDFMRSVSFEFLNKIMEAVKLSKHEYALVNLHENKQSTLEAISAELTPKHLIVFGQPNLLNQENYKIGRVGDITTLQSDSLTEIQADVEKKKALWKVLQEMFK